MISRSILLILILIFVLNYEVFSQKSDAEVIKFTRLCEVGSGKITTTDSLTIQINNRFGDKYTEIELPYSKTDKISDIDGWILNEKWNKVRELKKSDIVDKSAISDISLYEDDFIKCFQLKHNTYPYTITYTFKKTSKNFLTITSWSPIFDIDIPTISASLKIILPKTFQYNKFAQNISEICSIDSTGKDLVLHWNASYVKQIKSELYSQPKNLIPNVIVVPLNFQYGIEGSTKDWKSYGRWQYDLTKNLDILPEEEKQTISSLINGITDKREIIKILYHYLQDNTRYINVSIGIGGHKPYPASYVSKNKYGDCKALSNYMKALLSFAGIESIYALVYANEQPPFLIKDFAVPQFNHAVLAVPLKNDTIWLDNTSNTHPFGYMGTFTQNREALLICKDNSKFVRIPALKSEEVLVTNKLFFDLNLTGNTKVTCISSFRGNQFEEFNELHNQFNADEKDRIIRNYMPFDNYEVINWELKKIHRDTARIELHASLTLNKFLKPLGNEYYLTLNPCTIPAFSLPSVRTLPVSLPYPICNADSLIYTLPTGYALKTILDTVSIKTKYGYYELTSTVIDGKIYVTKRFELYSGSYSIAQYPEFYAFIQSVKDIDRKKMIIKPII